MSGNPDGGDRRRPDDWLNRIDRIWLRWQPIFVAAALLLLAIGFRFRTPGQVVEELESQIAQQKTQNELALERVSARVLTIEDVTHKIIRRMDRQDRLECLRTRRIAEAAGIPCRQILEHHSDYETSTP